VLDLVVNRFRSVNCVITAVAQGILRQDAGGKIGIKSGATDVVKEGTNRASVGTRTLNVFDAAP
jgi:hypothetical protein